MERIAKNPYSRNLWLIMKEFKVLPTDERFTNLTNDQIGLILSNMMIDAKQEEQARKGIKADSYYEDEEETFWDEDISKFTALKEEHDEEDIAHQVEVLTNKEELAKAKERFNSVEEWNEFLENGGALAEKMEKESYINDQLKKLYADAEEMNRAGISKWGETEEQKLGIEPQLQDLKKEDIQDAIDLFNGDEEFDMPTLDDEDDFTI